MFAVSVIRCFTMKRTSWGNVMQGKQPSNKPSSKKKKKVNDCKWKGCTKNHTAAISYKNDGVLTKSSSSSYSSAWVGAGHEPG